KVKLAWNNLHKNEKYNENVQHEFRIKSTRNERDADELSAHFVNYPEKDNPVDLRANFTKVDSINSSNNGNNSTNCNNITCIQLCCPLGNRLIDGECIAGENEYVFPNVYDYSNYSFQSKNKTVDELFQFIVQPPCQETKPFLLNSNDSDKYMFFTDGFLYLPYFERFINSTSYCLAVVDHNQFDAIVCLESLNKTIQEISLDKNDYMYIDLIQEKLTRIIIFFTSCQIVSMFFLLIVILVYSILPELCNTHSFMLRRYSSLSIIGCLIEILSCLIDASEIYSICIISALISYFFFLASFFWLSVMSFDMWWAFREVRSLRRNAKQQEKKKLIYSIVAWGSPFILTIICAFMELISNNVPKIFRPEFSVNDCWFSLESAAYRLYFYGPKSICIISSIWLSIYTVLKIASYEKNMARHLRNSESRCYNDNKQWFNLYLKLYIMLFIIIAMQWIMTTCVELLLSIDYNVIIIMYISYSLLVLETLQNISIFIIFVCKKKIMRLLLKRFYQNRGSASEISTRSSCYSEQLHHHENNLSMEEYKVQESEPKKKSTMWRKNLKFCCCVFLLIIVSLVSQSSSMSDDKKDQNSNIVKCEFDQNAKKDCDKKAELSRNNIHKNATKYNNDVQYELIKSTRNDRDDDDSMQEEFSAHFVNYPEKNNQMDLRANFIKADSINKSNNGNNSTNYIVPHEMCDNITCIQLCCPLGNRLVNKNCIAGENKYVFPNVYGYSNDSLQSENKTVDELFPLIVQYPCQETKHFLLNSNDSDDYDKYIFFTNGSLYLPYFEIFIESMSYCLAVVDQNQFDAIVCSETLNNTNDKEREIGINMYNRTLKMIITILYFGFHIVSILCLLIIFLVYSIFPELRNTHGFILRRYSSLSFIANMIDILGDLIHMNPTDFCLLTGFFNYFFLLASFFWLSVMSFDMWWTFREFRLLRRNAKRQEKKKLMYSIFAWGGPFILVIIFGFMEFNPNVPKKFRPDFGSHYSCWFYEAVTYQLYFYGPKSICIIGSICLSIYTVLKITSYEKDTIRHLRDSESRCYNDNKRWLTLYLKLYITLFIIMAVHWILSSSLEFFWELMINYISLTYFWLILQLIETIQNISIFIIFVCKKPIIRLILKRFC
ncbi:uncharacterized protein LOC114934939, partial [Nylanderia fulva]|uniref:uncharacterized protein LOC114934939 n=1 Tax=Nylanderia fulva TaxID=613905 RepID=UPI0010FB2CE4